MNYIYDIVLNFHRDYFEFYEWKKRDNIINIKKIPLIKVSSNTFKIIKEDDITLEKELLTKIKDKTYSYSKKNLSYACIICDGKSAMGIMLNSNGFVSKRSSLLIDEEDEVISETLLIEETPVKIITRKKRQSTDGRIESDKKKTLINYINKEDNIINLKYLYYDYFEVDEDNILIIKSTLINEINNNFNKKFNNLYNTVLLFNKIKN